jgi:class 3 adenylate cyclase
VDLWGRLSHPVQRRLSAADIGDLCHLYSEGRSIDSLARQYEVNRTTRRFQGHNAVVDDLLTAPVTITGVELNAWPLVLITEPGRTPLQLLVHRPLDIGRDGDGLLLADSELSRRHLNLSATAGRLVVTDLGSTNGTKVDGVELQAPTRLGPGQVVTFGRCRLELVDPERHAAVRADDRLRRSSIDRVADAAVADPMLSTPFGGGTLTIVFSDIEQAARRSEELGDAGWLRLLSLHNSVVRRQLDRHGGHEVKAQGDGFMLAFPNARAAVLFAIDVQRTLDTHGRSQPAEVMRVRIGMHIGEAVATDGDLFGHLAILASRIADQARGREILVSSLVREIIESHGDLTFGPNREVSLNGFSGAHRLHPILWEDRFD